MSGYSYFWKDGEVITAPAQMTMGKATASDLDDLFCVDPYWEDADRRYGVFKSKSGGWEHYPVDMFPKEFRVHLLLLGVS